MLVDAFCFHIPLQVFLGAIQFYRMVAFTTNIISCTKPGLNTFALQQLKLSREFIYFHIPSLHLIFYYVHPILSLLASTAPANI